MYRILFILVLLFFARLSVAQKVVLNDTAEIAVRNFSAAAINDYISDPVFSYEQIVEPPRSFWDRFWQWFWGRVNSILKTETGRQTLKISLILVAVSILVFFVLQLLGMNNTGLFGKKNTKDQSGYQVTEDDIHAIDFEPAIQQAIIDRNFRYAVRLLYLQTLKLLTDKKLINWQVNKTNIAYVQELNGNASQQNFKNLTLQFEYNWYGDLPIEENEFKAVLDQFNQFNRTLT